MPQSNVERALLDGLVQDERTERDERRGVETRATTLLAGSVAAIGLVAAATRDIAFPSQAGWTVLIVAGLVVILLLTIRASSALVSALRMKSPDVGERPPLDGDIGLQIDFRARKVAEIEKHNFAALRDLEKATTDFGFVVVLIVATLFLLIGLNAVGAVSEHDDDQPAIEALPRPGDV